MENYFDQLYAECIEEWDILYEMFQEDHQSLSSCVGGEILRQYQKNTECLLLQLDEIQKDLKRICGQ